MCFQLGWDKKVYSHRQSTVTPISAVTPVVYNRQTDRGKTILITNPTHRPFATDTFRTERSERCRSLEPVWKQNSSMHTI